MKGMHKISRGTGFGGALRYAFDREAGADAGIYVGGNMSGTDHKSLTAEFAAFRRLRPDIEKPVWHNALRLPAGERITPEQWEVIAADYMLRMGFTEQHPRVYVMHDDPEGQHIHIIASRVAIDGGVYLGRNENLASTRHIQDLERTHGLTITKGPDYDPDTGRVVMPDRKTPKKGEIDKAIRTDEEPPRQMLQRLIDEAKIDRPTAPQFAERLEAAGVTVRANIASTGRMNGFSFEIDGLPFKASQLGDAYKWARLSQEVSYEQTRDFEALGRYRPAARDSENDRGPSAPDRAASEPARPGAPIVDADATGGQFDGRPGAAVADADAAGDQRDSRADGDRDRAAGPSDGPTDRRDAGSSLADRGEIERADRSAEEVDGRVALGGDESVARSDGSGSPTRRLDELAHDESLRPGGNDGASLGGAYDRVLALSEPAHDSEPNQPRGDRAHAVARDFATDRTATAVRRQVDAIGVDLFEIGVRDAKTGLMMNRTWTRSEIVDGMSWLKRMNARGDDIYIRPAGDLHGLVLVDDLTPDQVDRMRRDGLTPAAVVETSPGNVQAWLKLADTLTHDVRKEIAREIARRYGGDPASADGVHYGRLAGFTNRKPMHMKNGRSPYVIARAWDGKPSPGAAQVIAIAEKAIDAEEAKRVAEARKAAIAASDGVWRKDPANEYRKIAKSILARFGDSADLSRLDYMVAKRMCSTGWTADQVQQAIEQASPALETRKAGHIADYAKRTAEKAWADPEAVKARQAERAAGRGRGYEM